MAQRFQPPTANLRDGAQDYSGKVNRAQGVAGRAGGSNYSGQYASTFSGIAQIMKGIGAGGAVASVLGKGIATDNFTKNQNSALGKYNSSAQALGQAQQKAQGIKNEMGTIKGQIEALNKVACDYADQLAKLQSELDKLEQDADKAKADQKSAQDKFNRAQQDFKNAMNPSSGGSSGSRKADANNAKNNMRDAQNAGFDADQRLENSQAQANSVGAQKNSTLDQNNANLNQLSDKFGNFSDAQKAGALNDAERYAQMQNMSNSAGQMRNNGLEYQEQMKTWGAVETGTRQVSGWADSVDKFGQAKFYEGSASAMNQTINTFRGLGNFGQAGDLVAPFLTNSITALGNVMERGGTAGDWGMAMGQAAFGLNDFLTASNAIEGAMGYMNDGDPFMASMMTNKAIGPLFDGVQRTIDTASLFTGTQNPFTNQAIDFLQTNAQVLHGEIVGSFEMAKAGGDFGGSLAMGASALPYALARGAGGLLDGMGKAFGQDFGISAELSGIRNDMATSLSGIPTIQASEFINVPPTAFIPPLPSIDFNTPDPIDSLADPMSTNSRGGGTGGANTKCPPKKPPISSLATEYN